MPNRFRILSLNGGGIRGIFQAVFLSKIAEYFPQPFCSNFDLISGTSTGAIIGMAVAAGIDMKKVVDLYTDKGPRIFRKKFLGPFRQGPIYEQEILKAELQQVFGNKRLRELDTKVIITSASIETPGHRFFANFPSYVESDENFTVVDSILSSTAAPTYFTPFRPEGQNRHYVDGGVWANSPSALAILLANKYLRVPLANISLLSIGTGDFSKYTSIEYVNQLRQYSPDAIRTIFELMFASQESFADRYSKEVLGRENYLRVSATLDLPIALDNSIDAIGKLPQLAEDAVQVYLAEVKGILSNKADDELYVQRIDKDKLVSEHVLAKAGLTGFYPDRESYRLRKGASSIDTYVMNAKTNLTMVSISLVTGIEFDDLMSVLAIKLEGLSSTFEVSISLLNPQKSHLMESICGVFRKTKEELANDITRGLNELVTARSKLSENAQSRFKIHLHNTIPFGSAIIMDHDKPYGTVQIETKAYKAPFGKSFGFEVMQAQKDGLYFALLEGYKSLIKDGERIC